MALPQQAAEKIARSRAHTPRPYRQLLLFSGAVLVIALIIYVGLVFGYRPYLESSVDELDAEINTFSQQIPEQEQERIVNFYSRLVNLRTLLGEHVAVTPALSFLEDATLADVFFTRATINTGNGEIALAGTAQSAETVARQAALFEGRSEVERVSFENAGAGTEGRWQFSMTVFLNDEVLQNISSMPIGEDLSLE